MARKVAPPLGETSHAFADRIELVIDDDHAGEIGLDKSGKPTVVLRQYIVTLDGTRVGTVRQVQRDAFRTDRFGNRMRSGRGKVTVWIFEDGRVEYPDYADIRLNVTLYDSLSAMKGLA